MEYRDIAGLAKKVNDNVSRVIIGKEEKIGVLAIFGLYKQKIMLKLCYFTTLPPPFRVEEH